MEGFVSTVEAGVTHVLTCYKPNIMFDTEHPAHKKLQEIGKEITTVVKPKAVVVFSAHWAGERACRSRSRRTSRRSATP